MAAADLTSRRGITAGQLLGRVLRSRGVDAVYGQPRPGVAVIDVDPGVAPLLASAHRRVHRHPAAVLAGDVLCLGDGPLAVVDDPSALLVALDVGSVRLDLDLTAPAPDVVPPAPAPADRWLEATEDIVAAVRAAAAPAALVGPGVVEQWAVPGLHALATALSIGVLNTWGAKGVFDWRSRHHFATVGLQALDFELGGLASADLILSCGLDDLESPPDRWRLAPSWDLDPRSLGPLAQVLSRPRVELEVPPLRSGLAAVTQQGWANTSTPLAPTLVTMHYGQVFGSGGLVAADAGTSGYWVARTFSTTELGSAVVPAVSAPGFAAACALVARLRRSSRPVLAVMDDERPAQAVLDSARRLDVPVPVEVWDEEGPKLDGAAHLARLKEMMVGDVSVVARVATDPGQLRRMIEVAGPVIAWSGT